MKYLIHNSDFYYPSAEEFDSLADAVTAFRKLRAERINEIKDYEGVVLPDNKIPYVLFGKDYLCIVIEETDPVQLAKSEELIPPK
jgi:hypothetical protein